ncbi:signal peptidase II [Mangrovactinospora gilvigrisea]|uniref:Lipoprotein signal peptidase n=1 Tax=Mangrovactinospora gilvigrisea TaxID=1428644 RepID=A0A1J7BIA0_9ACTN|nr:signal peptidase II [Mangrovactinospora gilvigrisea]OIV38374.1 signal peptidase II [Mangrovactinospora gilvigrisea]
MPEAEPTISSDQPETPEPSATAEPSATPEGGGASAAPRHRRIGVLLLIAVLVLVLDQVTKLAVVKTLEPTDKVVNVLGTLLQFRVIRNGGAAFSMGTGYTVVFTVIATAVIVVIARLARKLYSGPWAVALGLLLGGAFGNLSDRLFRTPGGFQGHVVDWIAPAHYAIFNLADSAIVCGGILIVILSFRGSSPDGTLHR